MKIGFFTIFLKSKHYKAYVASQLQYINVAIAVTFPGRRSLYTREELR